MLTTAFRVPSPAPFAVLDRLVASLAAPAVAERDDAYDLVQTGEDRYRLDLPVVGFGTDDLDLEVEDDRLTIRGKVPARAEGETVIHGGLARGDFVRTFTLAPHVRVEGASLERGLLGVTLVRDVPEALRPRSIPIAGPSAG